MQEEQEKNTSIDIISHTKHKHIKKNIKQKTNLSIISQSIKDAINKINKNYIKERDEIEIKKIQRKLQKNQKTLNKQNPSSPCN